MKKIGFLVTLMFVFFSVFSLPVSAATYNIFVEPGNDIVAGKWWAFYGNGTWSDPAADPNTVSHRYLPGDGEWKKTSLTFYLAEFTETIDDITSVTFNYDVLSIWTEGRDEVGNFSGGGSVLMSNGTGWQSFDVTSGWQAMSEVPVEIDYSISYTGYSGFTFGSADGGNPAFLSITTAGNPVPVPTTIFLLGSGLIGLAGISRRKK